MQNTLAVIIDSVMLSLSVATLVCPSVVIFVFSVLPLLSKVVM